MCVGDAFLVKIHMVTSTTMKITFVCFLLLLNYSHQDCFSVNDSDHSNPVSRQLLYNGQQEFSLNFLHTINRLMPNENLFFSPYSTFHALMIAYFISSGKTENYLKKVLNLNGSQRKIEIYNAYKLDKFATAFDANNATYEFTNANKIYVASEFPIRECIQSYFPDELTTVSFRGNPELARSRINQWVEERTHRMIRDLLPFGSIDQATNLVLVNAAYFKGVWVNIFDQKETRPDVFFVTPSKQITVDMMHLQASFNHDVSEELGAHILEMPYEGKDISMFVFLPPFAKEGSVDATLKKLTLDRFRKLTGPNGLTNKVVDVYFPKFSLEHTIELVPILEQMGVGDLFTSKANFSTLSMGSLSLGEALHKAKIEVNEEGTKAAAATAIFTFRSSRPADPAEFKCNHPFIYIIFNKLTSSILFSGVFRRPY